MSYLDLHTQEGPVWTEMGHYSTHLFTERAVDVINRHSNSDQPLFLYLAYQAPHTPLEVPAQYEQQYGHIDDTDRRTYAGMVTCMDEGIGNLTSALRAAGMWDDTVFVFSTDNGGLPSHGASNFPLKGGKSSLWEGGVRGVGMMAGGVVNARGVHKGLMHISDWFPTLVIAAGGNLQGTLPLDGVDQWSSLHGGAAARTTLLHNIDPLKHPSGRPMFNGTFDTSVRAALRVGDMKLITGFPDRGGKNHIQHNNHHDNQKRFLIQDTLNSSTKNVWLFNITADPREETDLSDVMPGQVKAMLDTLQKFSDSAVPPRYPPNDPQSNPGLRLDVWGPWV